MSVVFKGPRLDGILISVREEISMSVEPDVFCNVWTGLFSIRTVNHLQKAPSPRSGVFALFMCPSLQYALASWQLWPITMLSPSIPFLHPIPFLGLCAFMLHSIFCKLCSLYFGNSISQGLAPVKPWVLPFHDQEKLSKCPFPLWKRKNGSHSNFFQEQYQETPPHPHWSGYILSSECVTLWNCLPVSGAVGHVLFLHVNLFPLCRKSQTGVP